MRRRKSFPPPDPDTRVPGLAAPEGRRRRRRRSPVAPSVVEEPSVAADPVDGTLEEEIERVSTLLALLHREHAVLHTCRAWVDDVLPALGVVVEDAEAVRDVLAVAALGAGGVRPEVGGVAQDEEAVRAVAVVLHHALDGYADRLFAGETLEGLPRPDRDLWVRAA